MECNRIFSTLIVIIIVIIVAAAAAIVVVVVVVVVVALCSVIENIATRTFPKIARFKNSFMSRTSYKLRNFCVVFAEIKLVVRFVYV